MARPPEPPRRALKTLDTTVTAQELYGALKLQRDLPASLIKALRDAQELSNLDREVVVVVVHVLPY